MNNQWTFLHDSRQHFSDLHDSRTKESDIISQHNPSGFLVSQIFISSHEKRFLSSLIRLSSSVLISHEKYQVMVLLLCLCVRKSSSSHRQQTIV